MKSASVVLGICFVTGAGCIELTTSNSGSGGDGGTAGFGSGGSGAGAGGQGPCVTEVPCETGMLGVCAIGFAACDQPKVCVPNVQPSAEKCTSKADENCDGQVDCIGTPTIGRRFGNSAAQGGEDVVVDSKGNVVVTGVLEGTVDFGGGPLTSAGNADIFVAKFDASGNHIWSRRFGDTADQYAWSIAVDATDDIFIGGQINGSVSFGNDVLDSSGAGEDAFIAKLDSDGNPLWAKYSKSQENQGFYDIATDPNGGVIGVGQLVGSVDFGGGAVTSAGEDDMLVVKLDKDGGHVWSAAFGDFFHGQNASGVATDSQSNIYITGSTITPIDFGNGMLPFGGKQDAFLVKFGPQGSHIWSRAIGDGAEDEGVDVATDADDNVVLTIGFEGKIEMGGQALIATPNSGDAAIAKFNSAGQHIWSKRLPMTGGWEAVYVDIDDAGNIVATCRFDGTVDFGGGSLNATNVDLGIAKLDPAGNQVWGYRYGGMAALVDPNAIAAGKLGEAWVVGYLTGTVDFGQGPLMSAGGADAFLTRFDP